MASKNTAIVTEPSQGIGVAVVRAFLDRGYNVVGNARSFSSESLTPSPNLALVQGDIGLATTAKKIAQPALEKFDSIAHVVSNAGLFSSKPFSDYNGDEFRAFVPRNRQEPQEGGEAPQEPDVLRGDGWVRMWSSPR